MMQKNRLILVQIFLVTTLSVIGFSCKKSDKNNLIDGMVVYMAPPDNCNDFVIKTDDSYYKPSNLENEYKVDSLLISFYFNSTADFHDCGFGGSIPIIDLTHIENK